MRVAVLSVAPLEKGQPSLPILDLEPPRASKLPTARTRAIEAVEGRSSLAVSGAIAGGRRDCGDWIMATPQYQLDEWFAEPRYENGQHAAVVEILAKCKTLAETINKLLPEGQEKAQAFDFIRQTVIISELAIRWKWPAGKINIV